MKRSKRSAVFALLFIHALIPFNIYAQDYWEYAGGYPFHTVSAITVNSRGEYFIGYGGKEIWRSTDEGNSWERLPIAIDGVWCNTLAVAKDDVLLMGSVDHGLFRSTDNGASWTLTNLTHARIHSLATGDGSVMYAATSIPGVYRSTDNGVTWTVTDTSLVNGSVNSVSIGPRGEVWAVSKRKGVYLSSNAGATWMQRYTPEFAIKEIKVSPNGAAFFIYDYGTFVERTTDDGATWNRLRLPDIFDKDVPSTIEIDSTGKIYLGLREDRASLYGGGIYVSTNNGITWIASDEGLMQAGSTKSFPLIFAFAPNDIILTGTAGTGLYKSKGGSVWEKTDNTLPIDTIYRYGYPLEFFTNQIAALPSGEAYASVIGSGVFRTLDSGRTWKPINSGLTTRMVHEMKPSKARIVYAAVHGEGIYRIYSKASSWKRITPPFRNLGDLSFCSTEDGKLFAASDKDSLYISNDEGRTWTGVSNASKEYEFRYLTASVQNSIFAIGNTGVFRSDDFGKSWIAYGKPNFSLYTEGVMECNSAGDVFWVGGYMSLSGMGVVYRTADSGRTWEKMYGQPFIDPPVYDIHIDEADNIFIATHEGVLFSTNDGFTWNPTSKNTNTTHSLSKSADGIMLAASVKGAFRSIHPPSACLTVDCRPEYETLEIDPKTGEYKNNPFRVFLEIKNICSMQVDSVRAEILAQSDDALILDNPVKTLASRLVPGGTTGEIYWRVNAKLRDTKGFVKISVVIRTKQLPERIVDLWVEVPAIGRPKFSGVVTTNPGHVLRYDSSSNDYHGEQSPFGNYNVFSVEGFIRNTGNAPAKNVTFTILLPAGATLDTGETATKTIAAPSMEAGDSVRVTWKCIAEGFLHDSLLIIPIRVKGDNFSDQGYFGKLLVEGVPLMLDLICPPVDSITVNDTTGLYNQDTFLVKFNIRNRGRSPIDSVYAALRTEDTLVHLLSLPSQHIASRLEKIQGTAQGAWFVRALPRNGSALVDFTCVMSAKGIQTDSCTLSVFIPAIQRTTLQCDVLTIPADTLRYNYALGDYEGEKSSKGDYTIFPVRITLTNAGLFDAKYVKVTAHPINDLRLDTIETPAPDVLLSGGFETVIMKYRALADTIVRQIQICYTFIASNADTTHCCASLVVERAPFVTGVAAIEPASGITLSQNYPNPFNPYTEISYSLPERMCIRLSVSDVFGREIVVLTEGYKDAGTYTTYFNGSSYPSGVYFYRLTAAGMIHTKKMCLVK